MADEIIFSSVDIFEGHGYLSENLIKSVFIDETSHKLDLDDVYYSIETKAIDDRYYWFYSNYGAPKPRRKSIVNVETHEESDNPRQDIQAELTKQIFAVYDDKKKLFYISNLQKKKFFIEFFKQFTKAEIIIKNSYTDIESFIRAIESIESIKFTGRQNLFSTGGDIMQPLKNIFGYGEPEEFSIEAKYRRKKTDALMEAIRKLAQKRRDTHITSLVCIGKDDNGIEKYFNSGEFINKVTIPAMRNDENIFEPQIIQRTIIGKLQDQNV